MGKEKRKISYKTEEQKEVTKLVIIVLIISLAVVGVYFLTRWLVTKDLGKKTEEQEIVIPGEIQYTRITVGTILARGDKEYYVAVYDMNGDYSRQMSKYVQDYSEKKKALPVFIVDLSDYFNEGFYDPEKINVNTDKVEDLRFGDVTLLKIEKGKIVKAVTDLTKIKEALGV